MVGVEGIEPSCTKRWFLRPVCLPNSTTLPLLRRERRELSRHSLTSDSQPDASASSATGALNCQRSGVPCENRNSPNVALQATPWPIGFRYILVRIEGLEPSRHSGQPILSWPRLPISPYPQNKTRSNERVGVLLLDHPMITVDPEHARLALR
jgi:hypothetical protein